MRSWSLVVASLLAGPVAAAATSVTVGEFSRAGLAGWEEKSFKGQTRYAVVDATPYLTWTWRIEGTLAGRWVTRTRNVAEDLRRYLGVERPRVDAVAIMTDTDNSGQRARAFYGDIRFTAESPGEAAPAR